MTTKTNIIISVIILILIILYKTYIKKKYEKNIKNNLYKQTSKLIKILYIVSAALFIVSLIINLIVFKNDTSLNATIKYLINAFSISLLAMPISLDTLYLTTFENDEKTSHVKTIVTNIIDIKMIKKFKSSGINTIIISKENKKIKLPTIEENEITNKTLKKDIIIKSDNLKIVDKYLNKETTYFEFQNLEDAYQQIYKARGTHDNYIRTIKYLITTYIPLILSYLLLSIASFPVNYNLLLVTLLKLFTLITSELLYKNMPYDIDIMTRNPKPQEIFIGKQEFIFSILESFIALFILNIPYMFILAQGGTSEFSNTIYYIVFIFINLYMTLSYYSECNIIKNIFKAFTNFKMILYILSCIGISLIFNYTTIFNTRNIYLHNFISCILFSIISIVLNELVKLARFTTTKGKK